MKNIEYINAGAGSGKTYILTERLVKLLNGIEGNYNPSEVILTTFTELAANEFKERARESLLKANLYEQAAQLETAAIGTVHAVAYKFVKQYWYLLGRGANDNVMSEADKKFFMNQSLADIATEEDILFFEDLLMEFNFSIFENNSNKENSDFWKSDLKNVIEKMEQYDIENLDTSKLKSKTIIDSIFCKDVVFDKQNIRNVLESYLDICGDKKRKEKTEKFLQSKEIWYANLSDIVSLEPVDKEKKILPEIDEIIALLSECVRGRQYGEKLKLYIDRIFNIAAKWRNAFSEYKAKNRLIDYNDMEQLFLQLLHKDAVVDEIKGKFKLVFVDEFQDSSPVQVRIFSRLSELVEKSIWVGDPKQAIYGFRGSDAQLIKSITDIFIQGNQPNGLIMGKPLNTSYRSRAELVDLSNAVFTRSFADMDNENIELHAEREALKEFGTESPKALLHWHFEFVKPVNQPRAQAKSSDHYTSLAQQIIRLLRSDKKIFDKNLKELRTIQPDDIAILARSNNHIGQITNALKAYGLKVASKNGMVDFCNTAEYVLVMAILNYLQNKNNELAKAEILHIIDADNYSVEQIINSRLDYLKKKETAKADEATKVTDGISLKWENEHSFLKKIDALDKKNSGFPVPDLVEALICNLDLRSLVGRWGETERRCQNLDKLIREAKSYDDRCFQMGLGASLNNFIVYLTNLETQEDKLQKQKGAVNVLTYHSAKGLEWNVVVLESLDNDELNQNDLVRKSFFGVRDILMAEPVLDNLFPERYIQLLPWFAGTKKTLQDDIVNEIIKTEVFAKISNLLSEEVKRLMYVGITRARDYLITTSYHTNELKWLENIGCHAIKPSDCNYEEIDLWSTQIKAQYSSSVTENPFNGITTTWNEKSLVKPTIVTCYEPRYIKPSSVQIEMKTNVQLLKDFGLRIATSGSKNDKSEDINDAQIGTCLHNIFCFYDPLKIDNLEKAQSILSNHLMRSTFPSPEKITHAMDNLYQFLTEHYGVAINIYKEMGIQKQTNNGQIVRGSIDMVWETENGYVIVDYKSFPGTLSQVLNQHDAHYAGLYASQLNAYCDALTTTNKTVNATLLYYAILGSVVEVKNS